MGLNYPISGFGSHPESPSSGLGSRQVCTVAHSYILCGSGFRGPQVSGHTPGQNNAPSSRSAHLFVPHENKRMLENSLHRVKPCHSYLKKKIPLPKPPKQTRRPRDPYLHWVGLLRNIPVYRRHFIFSHLVGRQVNRNRGYGNDLFQAWVFPSR